MSYYFLPFSFFNNALKGQVVSVTRSVTTIDEGSSVTFTVNTLNFPSGTVLYYTLSGTGITAADFTSNSLSGSFTITNNVGTFTLTAASDLTIEGLESFVAQIRSVSISGEILFTSASVSINDTSGPMGLFYGGTGNQQRLTRIASNGTQVGSETVTGTYSFQQHGGAPAGGRGIFGNSNRFQSMNTSGSQVASNVFNDNSNWQFLAAAPLSGYAIFFGGGIETSFFLPPIQLNNEVVRVNSSLSRVGSDTSAGTARAGIGGATAVNNAIFWGGNRISPPGSTNLVTRVNSSGTQVGSEVTISTGAGTWQNAGANIGSNAVFYGGSPGWGASSPTMSTSILRINDSGVQVGSITSISNGVGQQGGATVLGIGVFYGGYYTTGGVQANVTRIDSNGNQVGSRTTLGTARSELAGAGV